MTGQLFPAPADPAALSPRMRFAYDLLSRPRTQEEVGMWMHAARHAGIFPAGRVLCSCYRGQPCRYASDSGLAVLGALRGKGLTIRRRSGLWERRDGSSHDYSQGEEIPF